MQTRNLFLRGLAWAMVLLLCAAPGGIAQPTDAGPAFKQEELDQLVAPIALYPDALVSQILMASTYPLEIVQADRFAQQNKNLQGNALTAALEKQNWDPSVKSLVNFPQVLSMMSEKLDWTQKLGDAFLDQQKEVLDRIQTLRAKAQSTGNLKSTTEQKVIVEEQVIRIEPASPQVIYVPTYDPAVVYGPWPYPAYPPYYYYPPGYAAATAAFSFAAGVAVGAAWGYAWGNCNWHGGDVNVNVNQNANINNNINREKYKQELQQKGQADRNGQGKWQHDASHRQGVSYRDQATAQKYNRGASAEAAKSREAFRGRAEQGRQDLSGGAAQQFGGQGQREAGQQRGGAFQGIDQGRNARSASERGQFSRQSEPGFGGSQGAGRVAERFGGTGGSGGRASGGGRVGGGRR